MAEWWEKYQAAPKPAAGNWWDKYVPKFDNTESGVSSTAAPSFGNVESGFDSANLRYDGTRRPDDVPAPAGAMPASDVSNGRIAAEEWGPAAWVKELYDSPVGKAIRDNPLVRVLK